MSAPRILRPALLAAALLCLLAKPLCAQPATARLDNDGDPLPPDAIYRLGAKAWRDCVASEALTFSPDGKQLAYIRMFREVRILDAQTGRIVRTLRPNQFAGGEELQYIQVAWSPDGSEIALRGRPRRIIVLDSATGREKWAIQLPVEHENDSYHPYLRYSPNGQLLAAAFASTYLVIDRASGEIVVQEKDQPRIQGLEFTADSSLLLAAVNKPPVRIWDLKKHEIVNRVTLEGVDAVRAATISPDGRLAGIACPDLVVVDLASGKQVARLKIEGDVEERLEIAFDEGAQQLVAASRFVHVWKTSNWSETSKLTSDSYFNVSEVAIRPDKKRVAICDGNRIWMWDLEKGQLEDDAVPAHHGGVAATTFSPDGSLLATGSYGKDTHLWDSRTGQHVRHLPTPGLDLMFSADGQQLVTTFVTAPHIRAWETKSGRLLKEWSAGDEYINSYTFSADRTHVGVLHNQLPQAHSIERLELPALKPKDNLRRNGHAWADLLFSSNGSMAAIHERNIELLDLDQGRLAASLTVTSTTSGLLAFTPDDRFVLTRMSDRSIAVWELASQQVAPLLKGHRATVVTVAFAPGGRYLASGDYILTSPEAMAEPRQIRFWDLRRGKQVAALTGHDSDVSSLAFSPDGTMLISGHQDSTVIGWKVPALVRRDGFDSPPLATSDAAELWEQLSAPDAAVAQAAVSRLVQAPQAALKLVAERLQPSRVPPDAELLPLIARLDSEVFAERQAAALELAKYGNVIAPRLRMAIEQTESAELRLRCQELLQQAKQRYPQSASRLQKPRRAIVGVDWQ